MNERRNDNNRLDGNVGGLSMLEDVILFTELFREHPWMNGYVITPDEIKESGRQCRYVERGRAEQVASEDGVVACEGNANRLILQLRRCFWITERNWS